MRTWHRQEYCSLLYVGYSTGVLLSACSTSHNRKSFSLIVHCSLTCTWDRSVFANGHVCQCRLFIYSVHWPGVKEMPFLFPPPQWGSLQTVPALATIQPKNNQERKIHLPHRLHTSPLLWCTLICLAWNDKQFEERLQSNNTGRNRAFHTIRRKYMIERAPQLIICA